MEKETAQSQKHAHSNDDTRLVFRIIAHLTKEGYGDRSTIVKTLRSRNNTPLRQRLYQRALDLIHELNEWANGSNIYKPQN